MIYLKFVINIDVIEILLVNKIDRFYQFLSNYSNQKKF